MSRFSILKFGAGHSVSVAASGCAWLTSSGLSATMARFHRDDIGTPITEESCAKRVMINTAVGVAGGLIGAWGMLVFRRGPSADPRMNPAKMYRNLCLSVVPMTTATALLYTVASCSMDSFRGYHDWRSSAVGGALAGALVLGAKSRTVPGALVGSLVFAAGAAGPDFADAMIATPEEVERKLPSVTRGARPLTPQDFSGAALRSSHNTGVLQ